MYSRIIYKERFKMTTFLLKLAAGILIGVVLSKKQIEKIMKDLRGDK
jgi:hypothetical protein